ncbi:hypothetical protein P171DRAFT_425745 [Karstenula rhodostoma CBS 690.94]|uniref:Uncharacterized protein n=1 Tax=Karstenula rhodostoma CBS 690.94 TaxID=1392251 RepID=A0A9P4PXP5_9PLEO|nr:hypothetical protein P171DRAFT_425745 [Karstenula rhodostoma CBS 690.94]
MRSPSRRCLKGDLFPGRIAEDRSVLEDPQSDSIGASLASIDSCPPASSGKILDERLIRTGC